MNKNHDLLIKSIQELEYHFGGYLYEMTRIYLYDWLIKQQNKDQFAEAVHLIMNSVSVEIFRPHPFGEVYPSTELLKTVILEIKNDDDERKEYFEESSSEDYEGIEMFENLNNIQKVQIWMDLIGIKAEHTSRPNLN